MGEVSSLEDPATLCLLISCSINKHCLGLIKMASNLFSGILLFVQVVCKGPRVQGASLLAIQEVVYADPLHVQR